MFEAQRDFEVMRADGRVSIPADVDRKFRKALLAEARGTGCVVVLSAVRNALQNGPDPEGIAGALQHFGGPDKLNAISALVAPIIEGLEMRHGSFCKWLTVTGFGNDKHLIAAFALWAERRG